MTSGPHMPALMGTSGCLIWLMPSNHLLGMRHRPIAYCIQRWLSTIDLSRTFLRLSKFTNLVFAPSSFSHSSHSIISQLDLINQGPRQHPQHTFTASFLIRRLPLLRVVPGKSRTCFTVLRPTTPPDLLPTSTAPSARPQTQRCSLLVSSASWLTLRISYYMPRIVAQISRFQFCLGLNPPPPSQ